MASPLRHYRAYHLDRDGHIKLSEIVSAESDEAALWDRARFVGKVAPYEPQASRAISNKRLCLSSGSKARSKGPPRA